ncbi:uncharacterized protein F4807DRAFT_271357 [Annulohypoxylon truncatum]|uniref:uncharacterized protein n=1 Tax=Annulohypoxylon truncatum TaxID=327061 RepID=UPI0020077793|nr:uncharacterized protein F4807DRAFT_271357 [Annulohypoxylon truncatum]KAI1205681.1 hypothetical protein F4807DRAFT_271357 [Annulohypoxylon truncatum]
MPAHRFGEMMLFLLYSSVFTLCLTRGLCLLWIVISRNAYRWYREDWKANYSFTSSLSLLRVLASGRDLCILFKMKDMAIEVETSMIFLIFVSFEDLEWEKLMEITRTLLSVIIRR